MTAQQTMYDAMDAIMEYSMDVEEQHFRENLSDEDLKDKEVFVSKLKAHIYYRYIQMTCRGDAEKIQDWIDGYCDMWIEEEEE